MIGRNFTNYPYYQLLRFSFYQKRKKERKETTTKENILTVWLWILYSFSYKQTLIDNTDTVCTYPQCVFTHSRIRFRHITHGHIDHGHTSTDAHAHTQTTLVAQTQTHRLMYRHVWRGPSCCGRSVRLTVSEKGPKESIVAEKDPKESQRCPWQGRTAWGSPWWHCQLLFSSSLL